MSYILWSYLNSINHKSSMRIQDVPSLDMIIPTLYKVCQRNYCILEMNNTITHSADWTVQGNHEKRTLLRPLHHPT